MNIFIKALQKLKNPRSTDDLTVKLITSRELSEEQKNTITTIVTDGIKSRTSLFDIHIKLMLSTGISEPLVLNKINDSVYELYI